MSNMQHTNLFLVMAWGLNSFGMNFDTGNSQMSTYKQLDQSPVSAMLLQTVYSKQVKITNQN